MRGRWGHTGFTSADRASDTLTRRLRPFFQTPGILVSFLDTREVAANLLPRSVRLLTLLTPGAYIDCAQLTKDAFALHTCLSSGYDKVLQPRVPARLAEARFPIVEILSKHLVDRRSAARDDDYGSDSAQLPDGHHTVYTTIMLFLSRAALHRDTCIMLAECAPLLAALIQCLSWDTSAVYHNNGPGADSYVRWRRASLTTARWSVCACACG